VNKAAIAAHAATHTDIRAIVLSFVFAALHRAAQPKSNAPYSTPK
jgi:hypothetical protein